jgi:sec-independent protein translocase protein TatC
MATTLRSVAHDDRLSLVEHLDELRTRLIICVVAFVAALVLCMWQSDTVLRLVNHPLEQATQHRNPQDPLEQSGVFQRKIADAARAESEWLRDLAATSKDPAVAAAGVAAARRWEEVARSAPAANAVRRPVTLGVGEPFTATFRAAGSAAILLVLPLLLYQAYAFVLPAFSPREKQVAIPLMLAAPFLFVGGVAFAYFLALPKAIGFLQNFNADNFDILIQARDLYSFSIMVMGVMGLLFQVPIGIVGLTRAGIVDTAQLRAGRRYAFLAIAVIAMLLPGQDPVTMLIMMVPLIVLYEASILVAALLDRRAERARLREDPDALDDELETVDRES